jgi:hypothetical protein
LAEIEAKMAIIFSGSISVLSINTHFLSPLTQMTFHHRCVTSDEINILNMVKLSIFVLITVNEVELIDTQEFIHEAAVEHATVKALIQQISLGNRSDTLCDAKVSITNYVITNG